MVQATGQHAEMNVPETLRKALWKVASIPWLVTYGCYVLLKDGLGLVTLPQRGEDQAPGASAAAPAAGARVGAAGSSRDSQSRGRGRGRGKPKWAARPEWQIKHGVPTAQCLPIGAAHELDERKLKELIAQMPLEDIGEFDLRVSHQPRAGARMPVGHGLEDNYVADNDRCGRSGAPGETSMSLALRRRDQRWDPGTEVPPGQLQCDECGRVFTMNGF